MVTLMDHTGFSLDAAYWQRPAAETDPEIVEAIAARAQRLAQRLRQADMPPVAREAIRTEINAVRKEHGI